MTNFERVGVEFQHDCTNAEQAKKTFQYSCKLCNLHNKRIECDRCAIRFNHEMMLGIFQSIEDEKERKREELKRTGMVQITVFI